MQLLAPALTRRLYPLRYWIFVAYAVGIPNFVKFDSTGLTHKFGLFNPTSISDIILTLVTGFLLATMTLLNRQRIMFRRIDIAQSFWILLLLIFIIASILQPKSHSTSPKATDLLLSLFRLGEWVIAFLLLVSLYTRETAEHATDLIIRLIGSVCWVNIAIIWISLPILPSMVYTTPGDTAAAYPRLGGLMIHPVHLAVLAGVAFFHAMMFMRGPQRIGACMLAFVTLVLTYSRSELAIFCLILLVFVFVLSRNVLLRYSGLLAGTGVVALAITFRERLLKYLERGQGTRNLTTLSERTLVWQASVRAIARRPLIGYGFISGAKNALRDQWNSTNWVPPHAHSEFIQALLSGGVLAFLLVVAIYGRALWAAVHDARQGPKQAFLLIVLLQVTLMATIMPLITFQFSKVSGLFLLAFVGAVAGRRNRTQQTVEHIAIPGGLTQFGWREQTY
jgi:O-antigen ligase